MKIHESAVVEGNAQIGEGTRIWHLVQVRPGAVIGTECNIGRGVYIDQNVQIGNRVKIQNYVSLYEGVTIEDGVFVGPHAVFTNDKVPRAVTAEMEFKSAHDWVITPTRVKKGAAIGANAVIVCGVTIGEWAMVGSGAVVTRDIPNYGLVVGNPARLLDYVCACGQRLHIDVSNPPATAVCQSCKSEIQLR